VSDAAGPPRQDARSHAASATPRRRAITLRARLRHLYFGDTERARRFRYAVLIFDLAAIAFVVVTSFLPRILALEIADAVLGLVLLAEFAARLGGHRRPWRELMHPTTLADAVAIGSFLAPVLGEGLGFLRVLRTLRLLHSYRLLASAARAAARRHPLLPPQRGGVPRHDASLRLPLRHDRAGL
jgi:voltage-gated potassium channel